MPYIKQEKRVKFLDAENAGDLNWLFTREIVKYIAIHKLSYQTINDIVGALEGAKMEFVRRVVNKYEDKAIERNGDVY